MSNLSRRDFIRFLMTLSAAGLASYLSGCKTLEATLTKVPSKVAKLPTRGLSESTPPANTATAEIPVSTEGAYLAVARGEALPGCGSW